jgi:hypothetical protein
MSNPALLNVERRQRSFVRTSIPRGSGGFFVPFQKRKAEKDQFSDNKQAHDVRSENSERGLPLVSTQKLIALEFLLVSISLEFGFWICLIFVIWDLEFIHEGVPS